MVGNKIHNIVTQNPRYIFRYVLSFGNKIILYTYTGYFVHLYRLLCTTSTVHFYWTI